MAWDCGACTFVNIWGMKCCEICSVPKGEVKKPGNTQVIHQDDEEKKMSWVCKSCTSENHPTMERCEGCGLNADGSGKCWNPQEFSQDDEEKKDDPTPTPTPTPASNLLKFASGGMPECIHHPKGVSQFTYDLTNACAVLALMLMLAALRAKRLTWNVVNECLAACTNPPQNAQVSDEVEKHSQRMSIKTEVFPGTGYMGTTNGSLADIKRWLEGGGQWLACIITTGGTTFSVLRVPAGFVVIDTHSFDGKGMVVKRGSSFEETVEAHFSKVSTKAVQETFAQAIEFVIFTNK